MSQRGDTKTRPDSDDLAFIDIFVMLLRHRWIIFATVLIFVLVGVRLSLAPRQYAANSMLRVQPGAAGQYRASQPLNGPLDVADQISPYVDILQSRTLFLRVAKDLDLANNPDFVGPILKHQSLEDAGVREGLLRAMSGRISVTHKPKDEIIRVVCSTPNNALSARVVNTLINDFVEYLVQVRYGASKRSSGWLISQLDDLKQQVERDQTELTALQAKLGIVGLNDTNNDYLSAQSLGTLSKAGGDATVERILAEAKYRFLQESDPGLIEGEVSLLGTSSGAGGGGLLQTLRLTQATQSSDYAKLLEQFGPNYPAVKQLKAQLDETNRQVKAEQARILNQAKLSFSAASANEKMTEKELAQKQGQSFGQHGDMVRYIILQHDYQSHRTLYEGLISRLQEAGITAGLESGEVDIVDLADVPKLPAPPGRLAYIGGALLAGLALGCILALLAEAISTRVVTSDQAGRASSLPALAVLPHSRGGAAPIGLAQDTPYVEAIEALRTAFLYGNTGQVPKVLLVTSALPREGKATLSESLATVLAQHGARVLLVDCDLRHNALAARFGLGDGVGLTSVLTGKNTLASAIQPVSGLPGLSVLVSGPSVDVRAAVLLGSPAMQTTMEELRRQFEFVLLIGAPVLGLSDVLNIGRFADGVLLVIRSRLANRKSVKHALQVLESADMPLLGFVLNDFRPEFLESTYKAYRPTVAADAKGSAA